MKTLAFSLALTLLVVGRCQGGTIRGQTSQGQTGSSEGRQGAGQSGPGGLQELPTGPCGQEAVPVPSLDCSSCPSPLSCGSDSTTCCLAKATLRGKCEKGMAMLLELGTNCQDTCAGTCGEPLVVGGVNVPVCCMEMVVPKPNEGRICPAMSHPDPSKDCKDPQCKSCAEDAKGDTTTEICCVEGEYHCDYKQTCSTDQECADRTTSGGKCIQPYGKETKHCCALAIPTMPAPTDMPQCEGVDGFLGAVVQIPKCSAIFQQLITVQNEEDYCTKLLEGIECFAEESFPNNGLEANVCLTKLKQLIIKDLNSILEAVKRMVDGLSGNPIDLSTIESFDLYAARNT